MIDAIFTYGTLKPGEEANHYLNHINGTWHHAYVFGHWINDSKIGYPVIKLDKNGEKIIGQLFKSNQLQNVLTKLDQYEGEEYQRSITDVFLEDGSKYQAYIYELA